MRQSIMHKDMPRQRKNLRLILKPSERRGEHHPVVIPAEIRAYLAPRVVVSLQTQPPVGNKPFPSHSLRVGQTNILIHNHPTNLRISLQHGKYSPREPHSSNPGAPPPATNLGSAGVPACDGVPENVDVSKHYESTHRLFVSSPCYFFIISEEGRHGIPMLRRSKILAAATSSDAAEQQSVTTVVA